VPASGRDHHVVLLRRHHRYRSQFAGPWFQCRRRPLPVQVDRRVVATTERVTFVAL